MDNEKKDLGFEMPTLKNEVEEEVVVSDTNEKEIEEISVEKNDDIVENEEIVEETPEIEEVVEENPGTEEVENENNSEEISEEIREELKKEIKEELEKENKTKRKGINLFGIIFNLILIVIAIIFIFFMYFANQNFKTVQEGNEPAGYNNKRIYNEDKHQVTVYEYGVYKIVVDNNGEQTTYMLKPIFFNDISAK